MKLARLWMLPALAGGMYAATTWDTSGNGMLNGTYYFRQVYYVIGDASGDLNDAVAIYGNIKFDGNGNYSITTAENARIVDAANGMANFTASGTYSISASGYGFMTSPFATGPPPDVIYGLVSANGIFVGSSTDTAGGYNDMMVAAPLASPLPTAASFSGTWTCASFDPNYGFQGASPASMLSMMFTLSPDGVKNVTVGNVTGYSGGGGSSAGIQQGDVQQYIFSNGAAVTSFPNIGALIAGQKYFYFSADGNFMFGGAPDSFDMIVGVKNTSNPALSGLYYQAGLDDAGGNLDTYFGSFNVIPGAAPQTYLGHERINFFGGSANAAANGLTYDYTYDDTISLTGNTYSNSFARYVVGAGGAVEITSGIGPYLGVSVALKAPTPTGTGVFLNPTGVVNSASNAPFTASIAPGELLTLYGTNLAGSTNVAGIPFPPSLGGVQVSIGGLPAPIYYVSPGQISAIVPYAVPLGSIVQIQVNNNGALSNVVTQYVGATAPGVFTQNQNGTGYGLIEHLRIGNSVAAAGSVVTDANPAVEGETLAVYLTGLGAVSPGVTDGAPGPSPNLSSTTNTIGVDFGQTAATNDFAGLAPGYSGLYQLNVTLPATGLTVGPNYFDILGPDSYMGYLLVPVAAAAPGTTAGQAAPADRVPAKFRRPARTGAGTRRE
jgi:uncharacterized protein (TIGR03437 family)